MLFELWNLVHAGLYMINLTILSGALNIHLYLCTLAQAPPP